MIKDLKKNQVVIDFFALKEVIEKESKDLKKYVYKLEQARSFIKTGDFIWNIIY